MDTPAIPDMGADSAYDNDKNVWEGRISDETEL